MNKRIWIGAAVTVCAVCLCLGAAAAARHGSDEGSSPSVLPVEETPVQEQEPAETLETLRETTFPDLKSGSDGYDAACYAVYYGLIRTGSGGRFDPSEPADRATVAEALYRLSGETVTADRVSYQDVAQSAWYADAVAWVSGAGIASGTGTDTFGAADSVSRNQLAVMLCRFDAYRNGTQAPTTASLTAYRDGGKVASYAAPSMTWALESGVYRTLVSDTIYPGLPVSRLQLAQILVDLQADTDPLAAEISGAQSAKSTASTAKSNHSAIQAAVDAAAKKYGAVGVQVAVVENGQVADTYAYGWATKNSAAMTADHKLRVASLSKVLVGVTTMLLREDGVVDLDASIGDYWGFTIRNPKYPDTPVSIRSILTHTSSIFNAGDNESRSYSSVKSRLQGSGFSSYKPGDINNWNYNNYAFGVLGMTLELASGRYVDDILNDRLFSMMEIDGSFVSGEIQNTSLLTTLYQGGSVSRSVEKQKGLKRWSSPGASGTYFAGGLTISSTDLAKVVAMLTQDGCYEGVRLMEAESVELMETRCAQAVPGGSYQAMPLRYWSDIYGRQGVYYHTGSAYGVYNCLSYDPLTGDGVVVLTVGASGSKDSYGIYSVCSEISDYIYKTIQ